MENMSIFDLIFDKEFIDFMVYWKIKRCLSCLVLFGKLMQNVFDKNGFEDFENTVKIWLLKYLMKLLGSKPYILNTLTCELSMWVCPYAMMLVIILSL